MERILAGLSGRMTLRAGDVAVPVPDFVRFDGDLANRPHADQGDWIHAQFVRWGRMEASQGARAEAMRVFDDAVCRRALGADVQDRAPITLFDG